MLGQSIMAYLDKRLRSGNNTSSRHTIWWQISYPYWQHCNFHQQATIHCLCLKGQVHMATLGNVQSFYKSLDKVEQAKKACVQCKNPFKAAYGQSTEGDWITLLQCICTNSSTYCSRMGRTVGSEVFQWTVPPILDGQNRQQNLITREIPMDSPTYRTVLYDRMHVRTVPHIQHGTVCQSTILLS